jgi:hypothetical protein
MFRHRSWTRVPSSTPRPALEAGGEWRLQRWDLPFDHPARAVGGLYDELILIETDELIEAT